MVFVPDRRLADAELERDDADSRRYRLRCYQGKRWVDDGTGNFIISTSKTREEDGEEEINSAAACVRARPDGTFGIFSEGFADLRALKTVAVQRFRLGVWEDLSLTRSAVIVDEDQWEWRAQGVTGLVSGKLIASPGSAKWTYTWTPTAPGIYRFEDRYTIQGTPTFFESYVTKDDGLPYRAMWHFGRNTNTFHVGWMDLHRSGEFGDATVSQAEVVIHTAEHVLAADEVLTVDPSFGSDAAWGADVRDDAVKFALDGDDWCGGGTLSGGHVYRVANRFSIASLPASATVNQVDFQINVVALGAAVATENWDIGPYNGDGQADPEADTAAQMYTRCDVSADFYIDDTTSFRTTGSKTFAALGATANADVEAARDAGSIFSVAIRGTLEVAGVDTHCAFEEYTPGADPPTLTITYTEATPTATIAWMRA